MTKQSGLGDNLYIGGYDLSGDIGSIGRIGGGPAPLDVTGIDKSGIERIGGKRDGSLEFSAHFNPSSDRAHPVLSALPTADVDCMYCRGTTLGNPGAALRAKQINYDPDRGTDGGLSIDVAMQSTDFGIQWGRLLTAGVAEITGAGAQSSIDDGAGTTFGLQAFLQVFAFTGTSATVAIQESSDDGSGDAFANVTDGVFTAVTGIGTQRIATANDATIERYLRANVSGTFTDLHFAVLVVRNELAGQVF